MYDRFIFYFLIFFIYSVVGYFCEILSIYKNTKKITLSRGFLIGPYLPIFGFGGLLITLLLQRYTNDPITVFILGMVYCCILEYLTSFFLERIFNLRWWDYSNNKFNINGRICLETGILFGVGSLLIVYFFNKYLFNFLIIIPNTIRNIIGTILLIIVMVDFIISLFTIIKLEIDTSKYNNKDATKEIKEKVADSLKKYRFFHNRLLNAFPNIAKVEIRMEKISEIIKEKKEKIKERGLKE